MDGKRSFTFIRKKQVMFRIRSFISVIAVFAGILIFISCRERGKDAPASSSVAKSEDEGIQPNKYILDTSIAGFTGDSCFRNAGIGMLLVDVSGGEARTIASINPDMSLVPASVIKLMTTATALELLGENMCFPTALQYNGHILKGRLKGNLFILGGGDPSFSMERGFDQWTRFLKQMAIDTIEGNIIGDAGVFEKFTVPLTWTWGELNSSYCAAASGLSINGNCYRLQFDPGIKGVFIPSEEQLWPCTDSLRVYNFLTGSDTDEESIFMTGDPYGRTKYIDGFYRKENKELTYFAPFPDPPFSAALLFKSWLIQNGIHVTGRAFNLSNFPDTIEQRNEEGSRTKINLVLSPPVSALVAVTNQESNNFYAEHLIKHLGLIRYRTGNDDSGARAITDFWKSKGMDTEGMFIFDGCGISRYNALTARQLIFVLQYMQKSTHFQAFNNSLPLAGRTGTLSNMFKGTALEGNLRGKTGTMSRVKSLAGYFKTKSGRTIAFSFIANNFTCSADEIKSKLEVLFSSLVSY